MPLVEVAILPSEVEAYVAQSVLWAAGIKSFLKYEDVGGAYPMFQYIIGVRLLVDSQDLELAKEILNAKISDSEDELIQ